MKARVLKNGAQTIRFRPSSNYYSPITLELYHEGKRLCCEVQRDSPFEVIAIRSSAMLRCLAKTILEMLDEQK